MKGRLLAKNCARTGRSACKTVQRSITRYPLILLLGAGTSLLLATSIAKAQASGDEGVKARVDDSRLTTTDREQQLLRRLQNRPAFVDSGVSGVGGVDADVGRMRFEPDDVEIPQQPQKQDRPAGKIDVSKTDTPSRSNLLKPENSKETKSTQGQDGDDVALDQELVEDLNEDQPSAPANRNQKQGLNNRQAAAQKIQDQQPDDTAISDSINSAVASRGAQANPALSSDEETQLPPPSSKRVERNRKIGGANTQPQVAAPQANEPGEAIDEAAYESMEESAETAHLSRGGRQNQMLDMRADENRLIPQRDIQPSRSNSQARRPRNLNEDTQETAAKASAEVTTGEKDSTKQGANEKDTAEKDTAEKNTAQQIQQLEALKENLNLQRELASNQGKIVELSKELEDTKKLLITAEKQVEELSQRLQHVGDRRLFNSETLSQRASEPDLNYNRGGGSAGAENQRLASSERAASRSDEFGDPNEYRGRSGQPRVSEARGAGSEQSLRGPSVDREMGSKEGYPEDRFENRAASAPGFEIPRQIQSETNTPLVTVIGEDVQLRSGPEKSYPSVMRLRKGERIVVEEQSAQWLQIIAPNGARAWIERRETNFDAIARGERVNVAPPADYRSGRRNPQMSVEDRALELIRRGGDQR